MQLTSSSAGITSGVSWFLGCFFAVRLKFGSLTRLLDRFKGEGAGS
jgi:hypothetical protein